MSFEFYVAFVEIISLEMDSKAKIGLGDCSYGIKHRKKNGLVNMACTCFGAK